MDAIRLNSAALPKVFRVTLYFPPGTSACVKAMPGFPVQKGLEI